MALRDQSPQSIQDLPCLLKNDREELPIQHNQAEIF